MKKARTISIIIISLIIIGFEVYPKINGANKNEAGSAVRPSGQSGQRVLHANAVVMKPMPIVDRFHTNSTLLPSEEVDLSFETSGKITGIFFIEGTSVKKGALLAKINDARLQAQLQKLEAELKLSESKEFRQRALLAKDAISRETYDQVVTLVETNKADIALIKAQINETELRAPFDGVVGLREVSEGAYVTPASKITKISKVAPLKLEFSIPERYDEIVRNGTPITFTMTGDTAVFKANVYAKDSKIDLATRTLLLRAFYPNSGERIPPGRFASVLLELSVAQNGISVPAEAVVPEMGRQTVFVARSGMARQTSIVPGMRTESSVQVLSGLNVGDTVLTTGILQLRNNIPILLDNVF